MVTNAEVKLNFVEDLVVVRGYGVIYQWGSTARASSGADEVRPPRLHKLIIISGVRPSWLNRFAIFVVSFFSESTHSSFLLSEA